MTTFVSWDNTETACTKESKDICSTNFYSHITKVHTRKKILWMDGRRANIIHTIKRVKEMYAVQLHIEL